MLVFGHHGCQRSVLLPLSVCSAICSCHARQCSSAHKAWICMQASSAKHMPMWGEAAPVPRCMAKHRFTTTAPESSAAAPTCSKFSWLLSAATALLTTKPESPDQLMSKGALTVQAYCCACTYPQQPASLPAAHGCLKVLHAHWHRQYLSCSMRPQSRTEPCLTHWHRRLYL